MKKMLLTIICSMISFISVAAATFSATKKQEQYENSIKIWYGGERYSFKKETLKHTGLIEQAKKLFTIKREKNDSCAQVFSLTLKNTYFIIMKTGSFIYDGINNTLSPVGYEKIKPLIKRQLGYFEKKRGYCLAERHNGTPVIIIYER